MSLETDLQRSQPLENKLTMYRPIQKAYNLSSEIFYRFTKEDLSIGNFIESAFTSDLVNRKRQGTFALLSRRINKWSL